MGQTHAGPMGQGSGHTWRSGNGSLAKAEPQQGAVHMWRLLARVSASHFTDRHEPSCSENQRPLVVSGFTFSLWAIRVDVW